MGLDLTYKGSNTKITPSDPAYKDDWYHCCNDIRYDDFFTLSFTNFPDDDNFIGDANFLVHNAPIYVEDNNSADFTFNTGIWKYDELMALPDDDKGMLKLLKQKIGENEKTKYIFIQVF